MNCLRRIIPNKTYYYFNESSGNVQERKLNLFQLIARNLFGRYKETHLHTVQQKAYQVTLDGTFDPKQRELLKNIFIKAGQKFGWDYFVGSSTFPKEYAQKSAIESGDKLRGSLTVRYIPNSLPSANNIKLASQKSMWRVEFDIKISGELTKHTFKVEKSPRVHWMGSIDPKFIKVICPPNLTPVAASFANHCARRLIRGRHYNFENEDSQQYPCIYLHAPLVEGNLSFNNFNHQLGFILDDQSGNQAT